MTAEADDASPSGESHPTGDQRRPASTSGARAIEVSEMTTRPVPDPDPIPEQPPSLDAQLGELLETIRDCEDWQRIQDRIDIAIRYESRR